MTSAIKLYAKDFAHSARILASNRKGLPPAAAPSDSIKPREGNPVPRGNVRRYRN